MDTIAERLSFLIKEIGITKTKFADRIHVSSAFITMVCSGTKMPSDRTIMDICREFSVSEAWLRDGVGEMFVTRTMNQELALMMSELLSSSDESFRKQFISAWLSLPDEYWPAVKSFVEDLYEKSHKKNRDE